QGRFAMIDVRNDGKVADMVHRKIERRVVGRLNGKAPRSGGRARAPPFGRAGPEGRPAFPSKKGTPRGAPFSFRPYFSFFPRRRAAASQGNAGPPRVSLAPRGRAGHRPALGALIAA